MAAADFFQGLYTTAMQPGELLMACEIPLIADGERQQVVVAHTAEWARDALQYDQADHNRDHQAEIRVTGKPEPAAGEAEAHPGHAADRDSLQYQRRPVAAQEGNGAPREGIGKQKADPAA